MKLLHILTLVLIIPLLIVCVDNFNNPTDSQYDGDYRYTIYWDSLTIYDTLELFRPYTVPFAVTGADTFSCFTVVDSSDSALVDTDILNDQMKDTAAVIYLIRPYAGKLTFQGIRPNGKSVDSLCPGEALVINPYQVEIDSLWGIGDQATGNVVKTFNSLYADSSLLAIWSVGDSVIDTLSWYLPFSKTFTSSADYSVIVTLGDTLGNVISLSPVSISITGNSPVIDSAWFAVPPCLGDTATFMVKVTDADSDSLSFNAYVNDTSPLIDSPVFYPYLSSMSLRCQVPVRDTGIALFTIQATDKSGLSSPLYQFTDTIAYTLPLPVFPESVKVVPVGRSVVLSFYDEHYCQGTVYRWQSRILALDTLTTANNIAVVYPDTLTDTFTVMGTDIFGYSGTTVPLVVIPKQLSYWLEPVIWPDTLQARHWSAYAVQVGSGYRSTDYFWATKPPDIVDSIIKLDDTCKILAQDSIPTFILSVYAVIDSIDTTNTVSGIIRTQLNRPNCLFTQKEYTATVGTTVRCTLTASDANGTIAGLFVRVASTGDTVTLGTNTIFDTVFQKPDTVMIYCWAIDNDGFYSDLDSARISITSENPYFSPVYRDTSLFIYDTATLTVTAYPGSPTAVIDDYFLDRNGDGVWDDTGASGAFSVRFTFAGKDTLFAGCINSLGDTAIQRLSWYITIDAGKPRILSTELDSDWVYVNTSSTLTVIAQDTNGVITRMYIDTTGDSAADITTPAHGKQRDTVVHVLSFANPGIYPVKVWVEDEDTILSDRVTVEDSLVVDPGIPHVSGLSPDTVWIKDSSTYTISAIDNKTISDYAWSLDSVNFTSLGAASTFYHVFSDSGMKFIYLKVTDNESNVSPVHKESVYAGYGAPEIDRFWIAANEVDLFVNDTNKYYLSCFDTNGLIKKIFISWDSDNSADDSLIFPDGLQQVDTFFNVFYSTDQSGNKTVKYWAQDEDDLCSDTADTNITIRLGAPALWGDSGDTLWVVIDSGANKWYSIHVNSDDTNGIITDYYWNGSGNDTTGAYKTTTDTMYQYFSVNDINNIINKWIAVKDDDNLMDSATFLIYADSVPPVPTVTHQVNNPFVMISWSGKDFKDGDGTLYQILCDKNNPPQTVISDFKAGKEYESGAPLKDFSFTFTPNQDSGTYYYKVIAKDARSSENESVVSNFDY